MHPVVSFLSPKKNINFYVSHMPYVHVTCRYYNRVTLRRPITIINTISTNSMDGHIRGRWTRSDASGYSSIYYHYFCIIYLRELHQNKFFKYIFSISISAFILYQSDKCLYLSRYVLHVTHHVKFTKNIPFIYWYNILNTCCGSEVYL